MGGRLQQDQPFVRGARVPHFLASLAFTVHFLVTPDQTSPRRGSPVACGVSRKILYRGCSDKRSAPSLPWTPKCCTQHICSPGLLRSNLKGQVNTMNALFTYSKPLQVSNPCSTVFSLTPCMTWPETSGRLEQWQPQREPCWVRHVL